jgi:hypothetical protein
VATPAASLRGVEERPAGQRCETDLTTPHSLARQPPVSHGGQLLLGSGVPHSARIRDGWFLKQS